MVDDGWCGQYHAGCLHIPRPFAGIPLRLGQPGSKVNWSISLWCEIEFMTTSQQASVLVTFCGPYCLLWTARNYTTVLNVSQISILCIVARKHMHKFYTHKLWQIESSLCLLWYSWKCVHKAICWNHVQWKLLWTVLFRNRYYNDVVQQKQIF